MLEVLHPVVLLLLSHFCPNLMTYGEAVLLHGRYTRDIDDYELLVPRKLTREGSFLSFSTPHFFKHEEEKRSKRDLGDAVHYGMTFGGDREHHLEVYPNHNLIAPGAVVERRNVRVREAVMDRLADRPLCHFTGKIRGIEGSKVAISTCDGLVGYISMNGHRYFVEPIAEHVPNKRGQLLHMVYERSQNYSGGGPHCGTEQGWQDAWRDRFRKSLKDKLEDEDVDEDEKAEAKRGLESVHRYLETLVVADKKFLEHHKDTDHELYIMTIMNMVSDYYHDSSSGNQMDVVVVRIMYLEKEEEEIDLVINQDAEKTLASFCDWQQRINPKDIKNPNHHDIAILLTRHDICADNMANCGLMGLAFVATACSGDKPCAINEDGGLILGIVTAHEMGHVMGCSHDQEDVSGCQPQAEDKSFYVMSPFVHLHTNIWSNCSRGFITALFDNDLGECLNDEPQVSLFEDKNMLPGTIYDAKYQCQMEYPGSSVCEGTPERFCRRLLCKTEPDRCKTNGEPPADGTKCGDNKWCYDTKCVEIGERPAAINGGWSDWGSYTDCSRTCGGGVSYSSRDCNNPKPQHKGRYCMGERKRVKICNVRPCPEGVPSFRTVQCAEHDKKPFQDKLTTWKPFRKDSDPCSLYCINPDNTYAKLEPRVKDGTRCKAGSKNMCVAGICRAVGCDNVLDSEAVEDDCGVCKGDGTECKIVDKTFSTPSKLGYVKVGVIFRGCRNVLIEELAPSQNTIAITGPDEKKYYLNGKFSEELDGVHDFGGVEGVYTHPEPQKEMLVIHGPLKENIVFYIVFYDNKNVGYRYKYAEPTTKNNYQPIFHWEFVGWDDCSNRCGGGVETSEAKCIEEKSGLVSASLCQASERPVARTRKCNEQACRTKWRIGKWGKCLACKDQSGIRIREVECVREASRAGEDDVLVEDQECSEKKPGSKELCQAQTVCVAKKRAAGLPSHMMQRVWLQTVGNAPDADPRILQRVESIRNLNKMVRDVRDYNVKKRLLSCDAPVTQPKVGEQQHGDKDKAKPKLNAGSVVKDHVDPEDIKIIEIPVKQSSSAINLTDAAYESMGDTIPDTLDMSKEKVIKGEAAAKILNEQQHKTPDIVESN